MRPNFLTTFAMATDQSSKLGQGRNKTIICMYSSYQVKHRSFNTSFTSLCCIFLNRLSCFQVIQMNKLPLILNFVATADCNTGHILSLENLIEPLLGELKGAVIESWGEPSPGQDWNVVMWMSQQPGELHSEDAVLRLKMCISSVNPIGHSFSRLLLMKVDWLL